MLSSLVKWPFGMVIGDMICSLWTLAVQFASFAKEFDNIASPWVTLLLLWPHLLGPPQVTALLVYAAFSDLLFFKSCTLPMDAAVADQILTRHRIMRNFLAPLM